MTKRTSGLSIPMPNATVAQMIRTIFLRNASCTCSRAGPESPAWYASAENPRFRRPAAHLLGLLPAQAVHDTGLVPVPAEELGDLDTRVLLCDDPVRQVLPVETPDEFAGAHKAELPADVPADFRDGRCRERDEGTRGNYFPDPGKLPGTRGGNRGPIPKCSAPHRSR